MKLLVIRSARLRRALGIAIPFALIPAAVLWFALGPGRGHFALSSMLVALMALVLFSCGFERRKTGARRLILVAVMTALSVAGRFVFSAIPAFKPITAMVVITAIHIGPEAGFLTGALSALISNFYFGQGPWTPFQMLIWGLIGLFRLDLVRLVFGDMSWLSRIIYVLVGICGLYLLTFLGRVQDET